MRSIILILLVSFIASACAVRRVPPIRFMPLLGSSGDTSMEAILERALKDDDPFVRRDAVRLLGTMTHSPEAQRRSAAALGQALKDPDDATRLEAVASLANFEADIAGPCLMKALNDKNVQVRIQVIGVLRKLYEDQITQVEGVAPTP